MDLPGQIIAGRYEIVKVLGKGGFSTAYLARHVVLGHLVVLKVAGMGHDEYQLKAFQREISALGRIADPNIVHIFDTGTTDDGRPFIILEWVDGESLQSILRRAGRLPLPLALKAAQAIASALAAAHRANIIHRDIKPSNVIIPGESGGPNFERAKLTDFGVIGELNRATGETMVGELFGTPYYMSPEQILAQPQSPATDVYGLGVLLYVMLYGDPPFQGRDIADVFSKITKGEIFFPESAQIPNEVIYFLLRLLDKDPQKRLQTADEAADEIRRLQQLLESQFEKSEDNIGSPRVETARDPALEATVQPANRVPGMYDTLPNSQGVKGGASRFIPFAVIILLVLAALLIRILGISWRALGIITGIVFGLLLIVGGILLAFALRRWLRERRSQIADDASEVVFGSQSRETLTASLAIQVDQVVSRVRSIDEKILANTMAIMVKEYEAAKECQDRMLALMNAVQLMEKLRSRFSPWYIQHEKLVTLFVALIGVASGVASIAASLVQISTIKR